VIYPDRGIVYDRNKKAILQNTTIYDLMVVPNKVKGIDTFALCKILEIDTAKFHKKIVEVIIKNGRSRPSVFDGLLSDQKMAQLNEAMYKFAPGFYLQERPIRSYPFDAGGNLLGYLSEVDTNFLKKHDGEGYQMGDYAGKTGLERTYEKVLMGQRGIEYWKRDNKNRLTERLEKGKYDTTAIAGDNMHLALDIELQALGEKLMENKLGSIVAIDPKTGGILALVSSPTYKPKLLTGPERKKHIAELFTDPRLPLLNRTIGTYYSPGSTFKTFVGLVGMGEAVIDDNFSVSCSGGYYGCGRRMGCHATGTFTLTNAISKSCNSYFATVFRRILDRSDLQNRDSALSRFNEYAYSFGLGHRLGVDLPSEKKGNIPTTSYYKKIFGPKWHSCNIVSNSIGQGEVLTTLTQLSNMMAIIANKGWYYTPHLVTSIEGGDEFGLLNPFKIKNFTVPIPKSIYEEVHNGMQQTMESGTGFYAQVPGITVCGKTGTVENALKGVVQKDHAFFGAFAPRENPRIAIAVMCENAGYGATSAAPIASLLIEKYLNDSIAGPERKAKVEYISQMNLIPDRMRRAMRSMDSIRQVKDSVRLIKKSQREVKDTIDTEEQPGTEFPNRNKTTPKKDSAIKFNKAVAIINNQDYSKRKLFKA
jgi:penicillin-binding protein 2